jgi:hypothetical protein
VANTSTSEPPRSSIALLGPVSYVRNRPIRVLPIWLPVEAVMHSATIKMSHALLAAHSSLSPTVIDITTRIPSMSSIRALPAIALRAMPKHTYLHYDACQSRCANTWATSPNVFDTFTRFPVVLSPPALLNSKLSHSPHAPRAATPVPQGKTRIDLSP